MKIAFLSHLDYIFYLFRLPVMKSMVTEGHKVYAVCPPGKVFKRFKEHGIHPIPYQIDRSSLNPFKEIRAIMNIYRALKPLDLDMVHTFTAKPNIYGTIAAKIANIPIIINLVEGLGSFYVEDSFQNIIIRNVIEKLYKSVFLLSDKVVFVNSDDPKYLQKKGVIAQDKIKIIKSVGIDTEMYDPDAVSHQEKDRLKKELNVEHKTVVLMVARAIWHKGIREFYEAAEYFKSQEAVQFVLVGDVDEGNPSSADEAFLNTGNVLWLGHRDDVRLLIAISDIFVLPSYREGVPRTLLEAASMSKPIITTDTVGCREVVEDTYNGYLVPVGDSEILVEKIAHLIQHPDIRYSMGKYGRIRTIRLFDIKEVVEQYVQLYNTLGEKKKYEKN